MYMKDLIEKINQIPIINQKTCIIFNTYNKPHVAKLFYEHLESIISRNSFDFYIVNNGEDDIDTDSYQDFKIVKGNNNMNEFSGIQKCINGLVSENKMESYTSFILCNDTIASNFPLNFIYKLNGMHIDIVSRKRTIKGHIDSFGKEMSLDNFKFDSWYRTFFIIINKDLFRDMNYKFMNYTLEDVYDGDTMKINIDPELMHFLKNWLAQERYKGIDIRKKFCCILNEYRFSNEIRKINLK